MATIQVCSPEPLILPSASQASPKAYYIAPLHADSRVCPAATRNASSKPHVGTTIVPLKPGRPGRPGSCVLLPGEGAGVGTSAAMLMDASTLCIILRVLHAFQVERRRLLVTWLAGLAMTPLTQARPCWGSSSVMLCDCAQPRAAPVITAGHQHASQTGSRAVHARMHSLQGSSMTIRLTSSLSAGKAHQFGMRNLSCHLLRAGLRCWASTCSSAQQTV